jgi:hypothetical protein
LNNEFWGEARNDIATSNTSFLISDLLIATEADVVEDAATKVNQTL